MRYLGKALGPAVLAVVAMLLMGAGGASATALTSPAESFLGVGATIKAESSNVSLDGSVEVACKKSTLEAEVANSGGSGTAVSGPISALAFSECGTDTVTVLKRGQLELHATGGNNGTLISTGAEITVQVHKTVFGVQVTTHCLYTTNKTDIGTFTGSATTKATAVLDIGSAPIPEAATDTGCGNDAVLTGTYAFSSPDYLDVDDKGDPGTSLTSPAESFVGAGTTIKAESSGISLDGSVKIACSKATLEAEVDNPGGSGSTVTGPVNSLAFSECGPDTVAVLKRGQLELHASGGNGTLRSTGAEITVQLHRSVLGFPVTTHCLYVTTATAIGTFTGSATTKATAVLDIGSAPIPEAATDGACGNDAVLTGTYAFSSPDYLDVDDKGGPGTSLTSPAESFVGAGTTVKAESSGISLDGSVKIACKGSSLEAEVVNAGGSGNTVSGPISALAFSECGTDTVAVLKRGQLELHARGAGNGTLRSTGAEITVQLHRSVLGFPVTTHCIYTTSKTDTGTLTGSSNTKATAVLDIGSAPIPEAATDTGCGNDAVLTGTYAFSSPDYLDVDQT